MSPADYCDHCETMMFLFMASTGFMFWLSGKWRARYFEEVEKHNTETK